MKKNYRILQTKRWPFILGAFFLLFCLSFTTNGQSIDKLEQLANGALKNALGPMGTCVGDDWVTGNVNEAKAHYACGLTIPYRMGISKLVPGHTYQVTIGYDTKKSDKHAIDFLTAFDRPTGHLEAFGHPLADIDVLTGLLPDGVPYNDYPLPAPTENMLIAETGFTAPIDGFDHALYNEGEIPLWAGVISGFYNGTVIGDLEYIGGDLTLGTTSDYLVVNFQVDAGESRVVLAWGGNIACSDLWGEGMSAEAIPGSPYHMFVENCVDLDGCGNKEVQLATSAILAPTAPTCSATGDELDCFGASDGEIQVEWIDGTAPFDIELYRDPDINVGGDEIFVVSASDVTSPYTFTGLTAGSYIIRVIDANTLDTECYADITEPPFNPPVLSCDDGEVGQCPENLETAFNEWKASLGSYTGGTEPVVITFEVDGETVLLENVLPPDYCGGSVTIVTRALDACLEEDDIACTFTVPEPAAIVYNFPTSMETDNCLSQTAVDEAFALWLGEATVSGGCDPQLSYGTPVAPDACGGEVTVNFEITDYCLDVPISGSAIFTVPEPAAIVYNFPTSMETDDCLSQTAVDEAFALWLGEATVSGGCDPQLSYGTPVAPDACGGEVTVNFEITDYCLDVPITGSAIFTVPEPAAIVYNFPTSMETDDCLSQTAVDEAFALWLGEATVSGGCDPQLSYGTPVAPDACGGEVTVNFEITDYCLDVPIIGSATFTVPEPAAIVYNFPTSMETDDCLSQTAVDEAFALWLGEATVSGGCDPQLSYGDPVAPDACGGEVTVNFEITDYCLDVPISGSAIFTVPEPAAIVYNFPTSMETDNCLSQTAVDEAFALWLGEATVSGGCDPQLSYGTPVAPDACGGEVTVNFEITDYCLDVPISGSAIFTVPEPAAIVYNFPTSMETDDCLSQTAVDEAFALWLGEATVSGGCDPQLSYGTPVAPDACGGEVTVNFEITDYCLDVPITGSAIFTVPEPAAIVYNFPTSMETDDCLSQTAVDEAFALWLGEATVSGGCDPQLSYGTPVAPDACGGEVTVNFEITDYCLDVPIIGSATFTVPEPAAIVYNFPTSMETDDCLSQTAVDEAFALWLGEATVSGGCDPQLSYGDPVAPDACGGSVTVNFEITDYCLDVPITGSATFTVPDAPLIDAYCSSQTIGVLLCSTAAEELDVLFDAWKAGFGFNGGCEPVNTNQDELDALDWRDHITDIYTGGIVSFTYVAWDDCNRDEAICEFVVPPCEPECETAYGMLAGNETCFIPTFSQWGWTNYLAQEGEYELELYAGAANCNTENGWGQVGTVHLTYGSGSLRVEYSMFEEYSLSEVHIYVGCSMYPVNKNGESTVAPGQYTVNLTDLGMMVTDVDYTIANVTGPVYVIAHAVVCDIPWSTELVAHGANATLEINCPSLRAAQISVSDEIARHAEGTLRVYPNPFSDKVIFEFTAAEDCRAQLEITNILGQKVATLMDMHIVKGVAQRVEYEPVDVVPGVLIYKLVLKNSVQSGRIVYQR